MSYPDYEERPDFTAQELEHILQLPIADIAELFAKVPRNGPGRYQGAACREIVEKLARKRVYADLIARRAVNAEPEVQRAEEQPENGKVALVDRTSGVEFEVRFPGDLRDYLDEAQAEAREESKRAQAKVAAALEAARAGEEPSESS